MRRKAVSQIIATIMLVIITLTVATAIIYYVRMVYSAQMSFLEAIAERYEAYVGIYLDKVYVSNVTQTIVVFYNSGLEPYTIEEVAYPENINYTVTVYNGDLAENRTVVYPGEVAVIYFDGFVHARKIVLKINGVYVPYRIA